MSREKILAFLNLNTNVPMDKFVMKMFTWFYAAGTLVIFLFGFLLHCIDASWFHIAVLVCSVLTSILSFLFIHFVKNPLWEWFHLITVAFCFMLLCLYGWHVFSEDERLSYGYPKFTWMHVAILCFALGVGAYVFVKFFRVYRLLKDHTVEQARDIVQKKTRGWGWAMIPLMGSPMVLVRVLKGPLKAMGLGVGFGLWGIACIGMLFVFMLLPRIIVICKYKVFQWYKTPDDGNGKEKNT